VTISIVGSATNLGNTITMPTHAAGDLLVLFAYNDGASTAVTLPTGWVERTGLALGGVGYIRIGYKYAQSSAETSGTWTNADHIFAISMRGGSNTLLFPNFVVSNTGTSATINYSAQTTGTFQTNAEDQALLSWVASRNSSNTLTAPTGMTAEQSATDSANFVAQMCRQLARTTIWPSTNVTVTNSALYRTVMLSVVESTVHGVSGGGSVRQVNIRGGADQ
jgi:hypothetical protein